GWINTPPPRSTRRLAAISGLFTFAAMRDPDLTNPVPKGWEVRWRVPGERQSRRWWILWRRNGSRGSDEGPRFQKNLCHGRHRERVAAVPVEPPDMAPGSNAESPSRGVIRSGAIPKDSAAIRESTVS